MLSWALWVAKKTTAEQRDALAACYEDKPQVCLSLQAPKIETEDYDEILAILRAAVGQTEPKWDPWP